MATKPALTAEEQQKIVSGFQTLRDEQSQLMQKTQDLEMDLKEHDLVLSTLSTITDKQRRCYRMIGGVLIEHTVGEVVPALQANREQIHNVVENFKQKTEEKAKDLGAYKQKYDIHYSHERSEPQQISKKESQDSDRSFLKRAREEFEKSKPSNMMESGDYNSMGSNRTTNDDQQQQQQQDGRRNRRVDYRFLIPSRDAGAIIGKGGKTIQELRLKHRCQIQMADCESPERVLIINGDQTDILNCISDILLSIHENHQRSTKTDQNEIRALIHQSQAGALIGKGASRVKEFREKHNIDVKIYPQCCPGGSTERCISMRGNQDDVINCLTEVYGVLDGVPPRGPYRYYDPSTYNGYNVSDYGGYMDNQQQNLRGNNPYGQPQPYSQYTGGYNPLLQQSGPVTTTQVTIPTELAGIVIGAKGSKISQVRQESGASIKIDSEPMPGTNDRLITITGNPNQIQQAQFLLQQAVRQSGLWNQ